MLRAEPLLQVEPVAECCSVAIALLVSRLAFERRKAVSFFGVPTKMDLTVVAVEWLAGRRDASWHLHLSYHE